MAGEITVAVSFSCSKAGASMAKNPTALSVTQTGNIIFQSVQTVGFAAHEALQMPSDLGTAGWCYARNLDATNFVQIGIDDGGTFEPLIKLKGGADGTGELALFRLTTNAPYAQADTGAVDLEYIVLED